MVRELIIDPELERCLPPLPEARFQKLRASIEKKYDPAKPIVLWKERPNTIVDGHHRYKICQELGVEPNTIEESFETLDDAVLYTLQRQIEQRNLSAGQLVAITEQMMSIEERRRLEQNAKKQHLPNLKRGSETPIPKSESDSDLGESHEVARQIAKKAGVATKTVYEYHAVKQMGTPELTKLVESGEVGAHTARIFVQKEPDIKKQSDVIREGGAQAVRDISLEVRREQEARRNAQKEADAKRVEALRSTKAAIAEEVKEFNAYVKDTFGEAKNVCFRGAKVELWCNDCAWGFDVYNPNEAKTCPYCSGSNIKRREPDWWPGKKVI